MANRMEKGGCNESVNFTMKSYDLQTFQFDYYITQVIWKRLYKCSSGMDRGTLYQLQKLINRRNVLKDPSKGVAACEEFFYLVVQAHILAAAMHTFDMKSLDDTPCEKYFPSGCTQMDSLQRRRVLLDATKSVYTSFVDLDLVFSEDVNSDRQQPLDTVNEYAKEVLSLGLLFLEYCDSIREGDGDRIFRCWRYFLPLFKSSGRKNYAIETFTLLAQEKYLFSPRMSMQLKWSRTINVHGRPAKNISADLHMEHLNRECKNAISGLGANVTDNSIKRVGNCLGRLQSTLHQFDSVNGIKQESGSHTCHSTATDMNRIIQQLTQSSVFELKPERTHRNFQNFKTNIIKQVSKEKLVQWMQERMQQLLLYH